MVYKISGSIALVLILLVVGAWNFHRSRSGVRLLCAGEGCGRHRGYPEPIRAMG